MNCAICNIEMKEYECRNPAPLSINGEDRVCKECNYFVTASRIHLSDDCCDPLGREYNSWYRSILGDIFSTILKTAFALRKAEEQHAKMLQEEEE